MMKRKRREDAGIYCSVYVTDLGCGGIVASREGLMEIFLPEAVSAGEMKARILGFYPHASGESEVTIAAAGLLEKYFSGEKVRFDLPLDQEGCTGFQLEVYKAVYEIPYGCVRSYKEVADEIKRTGAARGIGSAMAGNSLPVVVPCHRVIGSGGEMTGYSGPGGTDLKMRLLRMEGVSFTEGKKATVKHWSPSSGKFPGFPDEHHG
jgi:methylated-DNA-[protein]-cysteine S-methyltransferase